MTTTTIQLPPNFVGDVLAAANAFFSSFAPYITLIVGILLAVLVVSIVINAIRG